MNKDIKEKLKQGVILLIIVIAFGATLTVMLKYKTNIKLKAKQTCHFS